MRYIVIIDFSSAVDVQMNKKEQTLSQ